jgi:hypothetical protein
MAGGSAVTLLLVIDAAWCLRGEQNAKRIREKHQVPLSERHSQITRPASEASVKFRDRHGKICLDRDAHLSFSPSGTALLESNYLAKDLQERALAEVLLFIAFEQIDDVLRATVHFSTRSALAALANERPELRLSAYGLPPSSVCEIEPSVSKTGVVTDGLYDVLLKWIQTVDAALFSKHTDHFLAAPHIVVPLLSHLASLTAEDNLKFPVQLKRLADQFRSILELEDSPLRIEKITRDHLNAWSEVQQQRFAYLDGGVAKIAGLPGTEPTALRVGIYSVQPGNESLQTRETWDLQPFVVGDIIDKKTGIELEEDQQIDLRRLGEAARYVLEPLTGLRFAANTHIDALFLHGPLINQFVMYDEGEPHFIPFLSEEFLHRVGITHAEVEAKIKEIPPGRDKKVMWRQFMAIYGYVALRLFDSETPFLGIVERSAGTWLAHAVLAAAIEAKIIKPAYQKKVASLLKRYGISDDFLFGCVLDEGEYITSTIIPKNEVRRARDHWRPVVSQYPRPFATMLKTTEFTFPFRVEMNKSAKAKEKQLLRLLYHTARLLPRYAFPVGLDIVDKYAKVPDWLSKNISARLAASVLNRAMAEGDAKLVAQVRQLLAHTPRDFFYRPKS